jgi:photosystem II stability/assembly factor-like uncharacterized protein
VSLVKSADGGATWSNGQYNFPGNHPDFHALAFDPANSAHIYNGDDGGLLYSTDGGASWDTRNVGRGTMEFYGFDIHPTDPTQLCAGAQDNGLFLRTLTLSPPLTSNTYVCLSGGDGTAAAFNATAPTNLVLSLQQATVVASTDDGITGTVTFNNPNGDRVSWAAPLINDHATPTRFYVGTSHVYRSNDNGNTWSEVSPDLTGGNYLNIITVAPSSSNVVYTGSVDGRVYVSTNASAASPAWTNVSAGLSNASVGGIAVDPTNPAIVYVGQQGYGQPKVYKSVNSGATWTNITGSLPDTPVNTLVVHPGDSNTLFAGTDTGVFVTSDGGTTWAQYGSGLPTAFCTLLRASAATGYLTVSTYGRAMWRIPLSGASVSHTWYVDIAQGNDANPGTAAAPFKTVVKAITVASNGDSIYIKQGNYGTDKPRITKALQLFNWLNTGLARIGQP